MDPPLIAACVASQMSLNHSCRLLAMIVGTESDDEGLMLSASFVNAAIDNLIANTDYVSSCGIPLMPVVVYQVMGFGRGDGRHSGGRGRSVV